MKTHVYKTRVQGCLLKVGEEMLPDWGEMRYIGRKAVGIGGEPGRKGSDAKNEAGGM